MLRSLTADLLASLVVFLVALPLCLGIALASGLPPALGLVTGVVGGLLVGGLQGSPVSVSGPAAGLTVLVAGIVADGGVVLLSAVCVAAGLLQVLAGVGRLGRWFRAVPPALVHGMLAGIGVLIMAGQLHAMVDDKPHGHGLDNLLAIPGAVGRVFTARGPNTEAALIGALTIAVLLGWKRLARGRLALVPATLVGVAVATAAANFGDLAVARVAVPNGLGSATEVFGADTFALLGRLDTWARALGLAVVASAETLLCVGAVDRMHSGPRADYDRELRAQGVGNGVCGLLGALPMTAVIVRSSTNVQAGARTRLSAVLHGVWLLGLVSLAPGLLRLVPVSSLAAVLVFTGWKLIDRAAVAELRRHGTGEVVVFGVTLATIVATDLLIGVLAGLVVATAQLLRRLAHVHVAVEHDGASLRTTLRLRGSATFLRLPDIADALAAVPPGREIHVRLDGLAHMDHAAVELLAGWEKDQRSSGARAVVDWDSLPGPGARLVDLRSELLLDQPGVDVVEESADLHPSGDQRV